MRAGSRYEAELPPPVASTGGTSCVSVGAKAEGLAGIERGAKVADGAADLIGHRFDWESTCDRRLPRIDQRAQRSGAVDRQRHGIHVRPRCSARSRSRMRRMPART